MYNILKLKLKSKLRTITKETTRAFRIMILGFTLIIAILTIKYKPVYEVTTTKEILGYVADKKEFKSSLEEQITIIQGENIDNISLEEEPQYELKLVARNKETNETEIIEKLKEDVITTYKFYAVTLNNENLSYVDTLQEAEESVEDEIEQLLEEKEAAEAISTINGINLSVLPVSGRITSRYGERSSIRSSTHTGLDIACSTGTPIKAVAKGTVVFAERNGSYGNLVKIDHGNGVQTWYAHCNSIETSVGTEVKSGDVIATVGSTGNSTGPHLHLEIRINGTAVNPQKYLY